ncbi:MAG: hypothetical protein ACR2NA_00775 [Solirubrobacterales bacterium]
MPDRYVEVVREYILNGVRAGEHPTSIASRLYHATKDGSIDWRRVAQTEAARANNEGKLVKYEDMGFDRVWASPHVGACQHCKRLIENKDFPIEQVRGATNHGREQADWVPCIPLHPNCRHSWAPYDERIVEQAREEYARIENAGWNDRKVMEEFFETSGQVKPEYADLDWENYLDWDLAEVLGQERLDEILGRSHNDDHVG